MLSACRVPFVYVILVTAWGQFLLIRFYKVSFFHAYHQARRFPADHLVLDCLLNILLLDPDVPPRLLTNLQ